MCLYILATNPSSCAEETQWKQQSIPVKWPLSGTLGPPVLALPLLPTAFPSCLSAVTLLSSLPPERTNSSLPHVITTTLTNRYRGSLHSVNTPIAQPLISQPNTYAVGRLPSPMLLCSRWIFRGSLCCHQKPDLRDKQLDQSYKKQHHLHNCKKHTFRKKLHWETCLQFHGE